jgi:hypothetical protein
MLKLYGERNTNTNYLTKLIDLNLEVTQLRGEAHPLVQKIQRRVPGHEWVRDIYFLGTRDQNCGWKHTRLPAVETIRSYSCMRADIAFVSLTKNPYSWLLSLYRNPYHSKFKDRKLDFETFLQTPWKTFLRENCPRVVASPIELWNIKNASYLQLQALNGLNLTTESSLQDPASLIERIASHFSLRRKSPDFVPYEKSTKQSDKDSNYYRDFYLNEKWRQELTAGALAIINRQVDRNLMNHFGYQIIS